MGRDVALLGRWEERPVQLSYLTVSEGTPQLHDARAVCRPSLKDASGERRQRVR